jgi:hypothetical protein
LLDGPVDIPGYNAFEFASAIYKLGQYLVEKLPIDAIVVRPRLELRRQLIGTVASQLHLVQRLHDEFTSPAACTG